MNINILPALVSLIGGAAIAVINSIITAKAMKKGSNAAAASSLIRSALNIGYFAAVFMIFRGGSCNIIYPLLAAAVGLTVPSIILAIRISSKIQHNADNQKEEGK